MGACRVLIAPHDVTLGIDARGTCVISTGDNEIGIHALTQQKAMRTGATGGVGRSHDVASVVDPLRERGESNGGSDIGKQAIAQ